MVLTAPAVQAHEAWIGRDSIGPAGVERSDIHLRDFTGILQVDGYRGYTALAKRRGQQLSLAFCWSHIRKFYDLAASSPVETEILRRIAMLYAIKDEMRGCTAKQRRIQRAECSRLIVEDLRLYVDARLAQISAKSKLAEAIRYATTLWRSRPLHERWSNRATPTPSSDQSAPWL